MQNCNRRNPIGFIVSNEIWGKAIGENIVVCPTYCDEKADLEMLSMNLMKYFQLVGQCGKSNGLFRVNGY